MSDLIEITTGKPGKLRQRVQWRHPGRKGTFPPGMVGVIRPLAVALEGEAARQDGRGPLSYVSGFDGMAQPLAERVPPLVGALHAAAAGDFEPARHLAAQLDDQTEVPPLTVDQLPECTRPLTAPPIFYGGPLHGQVVPMHLRRHRYLDDDGQPVRTGGKARFWTAAYVEQPWPRAHVHHTAQRAYRAHGLAELHDHLLASDPETEQMWRRSQVERPTLAHITSQN